MTKITITLPNDVRLFRRSDAGRQLARTDTVLKKSRKVAIGQIERLIYDHEDKDAVPYNVGVLIYYILPEEIQNDELVARSKYFRISAWSDRDCAHCFHRPPPLLAAGGFFLSIDYFCILEYNIRMRDFPVLRLRCRHFSH